MARYLVGIDLGTTNIALAYVDTASRARAGRSCTPSPCRSWSPPGRCRNGRCCRRSSTCPARTTCRRARSTCRGRRVRPTLSASSPATTGRRSRPAGVVREVVAVPRRRRSHARRCCRGLRRPTCRDSRRSRRRRELPAAHRRGLEPRSRPQGRGPARRSRRSSDRAGVVRRRGPQPDRRGREAGRAEERHAAGGAAGRVLLLARHALRRTRPAMLKPGMRCLVVDVGGGTTRLQPDPGRRGEGRADLRPRGGRRPPAARRRQHGPGAGQVRRDEAARRAGSTRPSTGC